MKKQWIVLSLFLLSWRAFGAHHFTDVFEAENGWRVNHFVAREGELQDLVESRLFSYEAQALSFEEDLKKRYPPQKNFSYSVTEAETAPLWIVKNNWDQSWEDKFSQWIQDEFTADFFVTYNLATDCADVSYALRWIFARNNNLPATATLGGSGAVVSHLSAKKEWDKLPGHTLWHKDKRFLAALNWLLDMVYTKTLYVDSYPVELNARTIKAGLTNLIGNHSEIIARVSLRNGDVPIEAMSSTVPQAVRVLNKRIFMDDAVTERRLGGLLRFRWPTYANGAWRVVPAQEMPFYSLSQYKKDLCADQPHFTFCLFQILNYQYDASLLVKGLIRDISDYIEARNTIVQSGFAFCSQNDCAPGTQGYEDWGTPSRDKRLGKWLADTEALSETLGGRKTFDEWINRTTLKVPFSMPLKDFKERIVLGLTSYDPRDPAEARWGKTLADIENTMRRFAREGLSAREALIAKAASCRQDPESCKKSPSSFKTLSSAEMDFDQQKRFGKFVGYFKEKAYPVSSDLALAFKGLWFKSPAPWDSLVERRGLEASESGHLLEADLVQDGGEDLLILDHRTLYRISDRSRLPAERETKGLYYDPTVKRYLSHDAKTLRVLSDRFDVLKEFPLQGYSDDLPLVHFFGTGDVFIGECLYESRECFGTKEGFLLNLESFERSEGVIFYQSFTDKTDPSSLFLAGKTYLSFQATTTGVSQKSYPLLERPLISAVHLQGHDHFLQLGQFDGKGFDMGYLLGKGFSPLVSGYSTFFVPEKVTPSWLSLRRFYGTSEGTEYEGLINLQTQAFTPGAVTVSFSPVKDQRLVMKNANKKISLFTGGSFKDFSLGSQSYQSILSAAETWWSLDSGAVYDYQGQLLMKDGLFLRGVCRSSLYQEDCVGTSDALFFELYGVQSADDYTYFRFGKNDRMRVTRVSAYKIHQGAPTTSAQDHRVEKGNALVLSDHHLLWFP